MIEPNDHSEFGEQESLFSPPENEVTLSGQSHFGLIALYLGAAIVCLAFVEQTTGLPVSMPRSWYVNRPLWYLCGLTFFLTGWFLLKNRSVTSQETGRPSKTAFQRVVLYTRNNCHLCDDAKAVLNNYYDVLPAVEEVDVDSDPQLVEQFGKCVPVVEIDGKVRFRGKVNEVLLRRLMNAASEGDEQAGH